MDEVAEQVEPESSEDFWREHIVAAGKFNGSNTLYCRVKGLSHKTFSVYKVKLGFSKPKGRPKAFIEVKQPKAAATAELPRVQVGPKKSLPDPKWLAEFVVALMGVER